MKKNYLFYCLLLLTSNTIFSQSTIEFIGAPGSGGPAGTGPVVTGQTATFFTTTATAFSPAVTATYTLSNQQFASIEGNAGSPGTQFGGGITTTVNSPVPGSNIYDLMNALSGSANANYTACNSCTAGTGVDVTVNRSIQLTNFSDALIDAAGTQLQAYNARVQYADMTITFNRPVSNPMLHITGLGGQVSYSTTITGVTTNYDLGFTTDIDLLTPGLTLSKISGNTALTVTSTAVTNNSARFGAATTPTALHGITRSAASGTVVVQGTNITTITLRFFLKGDGGIVVDNLGNVVAANNGNIVRWGFHAGFVPGGTVGTLVGVSGDGFLFGLSLQQPVNVSGTVFNDPNAGNVNNSTGGANVIPSGLNANLIDAGGKVVATVPVNTDGTYSFPAIFEGSYSVNISPTAGTQGTAAPAAAPPTGWGITGEFNGTPNTGNDGTPNGTSAVFTVVATDVTNINFGIQRAPESAVNLQPTGGNPGGFNSQTVPTGAFQTNNVGVTPNTSDFDGGTVTSMRITAFPSNANSITINGTVYTNGGTCPPATTCTPWPGGGVTIPYTNGTGPTQAISVDPVDGNVDVVIPFAAIDNAGKEDPTPGSVTIPFRVITLAGTVWNDLDANLSLNGAETVINGTNSGGGILTGATLYANLIDALGKVIATVPIASDGTYNFPNVPQSTSGLTVQLSTNQGTVGLAKPATALPAGWVTTGENKNGQGGAADGTPNGEIVVNTATTNITQQNFGIQQTPESAFNLQPTGGNPGGFNSQTVPASAFQTNNVGVTPNTSDYNGGTVTSIRITAFPSNANSITINGTVYTNGGTCPPATTCTPWPGGGVTVPYTNGVGPAQAISVDPVDGNVDVVIPFAAIDNAGKEDPTPGSVTIPFRTITLAGSVWNDLDGNLSLNGTETAINGTNSGGGILTGSTLYANLIDALGKVIATVPIAADGTYNFPNVPQSTSGLTVQLSTNQGTVGLAKPATALPVGWVTTGENKNGQGGAADGTPNSEIVVNTATTNITLQNFGIEQTPESAVNLQPAAINPTGFNNVTVPAGAFQNNNVGITPNTSDYNGGTVSSIRITSFPSNTNTITINGTVYINGGTCPPATTCVTWPVLGVTVPYTNGVGPAQTITIDPIDGLISVVIPFAAIDNAGKEDATPGSVTIPFTLPLPVTISSFTAQPSGSQVNLVWKVEDQLNIKNYTVEHGINGRDFVSITTVAANSNFSFTYTAVHFTPITGINYYRIKITEKDGSFHYSDIRKVNFGKGSSITIYPNPANAQVNITLTGTMINRPATISLVSIDGKIMQWKKLSAVSQTETLDVSKLANGKYIIRIVTDAEVINKTIEVLR